MKKNFVTYLIIFGLMLTACNNDVFIEHLEIAPETSEMGPDTPAVFLKVSGKDWHVFRINYSDGDNYTFGGPDDNTTRWDGNVLNIVTDRSSLSVEIEDDGIEVKLDRYLGEEKACLIIDVEGEYQQKSAEIIIAPTGSFDIKITSVKYNLANWSDYPEKNYTYNLYTLNFSQGLAEPMEYSFAQPTTMPIIYKFRLRGNENEFEKRLLNSHIKIPVPEYTGYTSFETSQPWVLLGQEVPLSSNQSSFDSSVMIPRMPNPISLPAGKPLVVSLLCEQECVGLDLTVSTINPVTGESTEVLLELVMFRPVKFTTELTMK